MGAHNDCNNEDEKQLTTGQQATTVYIPVPGPAGPKGDKGDPGIGIPGATGPQGPRGDAGDPTITEYFYKLTNTNTAPAKPTINFAGEGWASAMLNTDPNNRYQWVSYRHINGAVEGPFSNPVLYSNYAMPGLDGKDGVTIEFIYKLSATNTVPDLPIAPPGVDDFIPAGWTDNATGPNDSMPFEFFTKRMKVADQWKPYDTPALWAKHAADGQDGKDGKDIEFIFKRTATDVTPEIPVGNPALDENFPSDWTDEPVSVDANFQYQWFAKRTKSGVAWTTYSVPVLWTKFAVDGLDGQDGTDYEWVFRKTEQLVVPNTPEAPSQTVDDFVPEDWTDEPTGVTELMPYEYASQRRKVNGTWGPFSTPALWSKWGFDGVDGDVNEYIFKRTTSNTRPSAPTEVSQEADFVPAGWTDEPADISTTYPYQWQSRREKVNGVWSAFKTPKLVHVLGGKGESGLDGKNLEQRWAKNGSATNAPGLNATQDYPVGWITAPMTLLDNEYLWMTSATKNYDGSLIGTWSQPVRVSGINGTDGEDGKGIEFIFKLGATASIPGTPASVNEDDSVPAGWADDQQGVSPSYPYEFVSNRKKSNGVWGNYSTPVIWAKYSADGEDGIDGKSVEFIFKSSSVTTPPSTPPTSQADDYVPTGWTDNATGVGSSNPYEFVSKRTKTNGVWSAFSTPKLWAQMGAKGDTVVGPAIVYKGMFSPTAQYVGDNSHVEVVKYIDGTVTKYYMTRTDAGTITIGTYPTNATKWDPFVGQFENIATGLLFAERAVVENLVVTEIQATTGKIANFSIIGNKLESTDAATGARITIDSSPILPYIEIVGDRWTRIDSNGLKTTFGNAFQFNVGQGLPDYGTPGDGGLFIDCDNVFYRHGNDPTTGNPWYGGRSGPYSSNGYALIQQNGAGTGPKMNVATLNATTLYSSTGTVSVSDVRFKTDIVKCNYGLEALRLLEAIQFKYDLRKSKNPLNAARKDDGKVHLGFRAQDVQAIIPELVTEDENKELALNITELIPVLRNAIVELHELLKLKADK